MKKSAILCTIICVYCSVFFSSCSKIEPNVITNDLSTVTYAAESKVNTQSKTLGTYSTKFSTYVSGRNKNIKRASDSINGKVIQPGKVFSYNESLGPTTKENGYKMAKIFDKGKEKKGYGGGVCQVSSTLYNAAELSGLEIVERHPHTKKVNYVPENKDAATSYGKIDFRFKNNFDFPIVISSNVAEDSVTVEIKTV